MFRFPASCAMMTPPVRERTAAVRRVACYDETSVALVHAVLGHGDGRTAVLVFKRSLETIQRYPAKSRDSLAYVALRSECWPA